MAALSKSQELSLVSEYSMGIGATTLATKYGCSVRVALSTIRRNGVKVRTAKEAARLSSVGRRSFSTEQEVAIVELYNNGSSTYDIAEAYNSTGTAILGVLKRHGISRRTGSTYCTVNEDAFANPERNEEAAYFLGLLYADGCVTEPTENRKKYSVSLSLSGKDGEMVDRFAEFLSSTFKVSYSPPKDRGRIKSSYSTATKILSDKLAASVMKYGVVPRKSTKEVPPETLKYNRHWLRGLTDGDGCLGISRRGYPEIGVCGSYATCENWLAYAATISDSKASACKGIGQVWKATLTGKAAVAMVESLYKNCLIALPRKLAIANEILSNPRKFDWTERGIYSNSRLLTYDGNTMTLANWARKLNMPYHTLKARLRQGMSVERAIATPWSPSTTYRRKAT